MKSTFVLLVLALLGSFTLSAESAAAPNGTVIEQKSANGHQVLRQKHEQEVVIGYSAQDYQMIIYDSPTKKTRIGELKKGDKISIKETYMIDSNELWLKFPYLGKDGYILFETSGDGKIYDMYRDGLWQPVAEIESEGIRWHTLKCEGRFLVYTNLNIRDKPGTKSAKIGMITATQAKYVVVDTVEVTVEKETIDQIKERWAKIKYGNIVGWVFAGYLEYERGGPRFNTPESHIEMSLGKGP